RVAAEHRDVLTAAVVPGPLVRREIDLDPGAQQSGELLVVRARAAQDPLESRRMMQHIGELPRAQQRRGPESGTRHPVRPRTCESTRSPRADAVGRGCSRDEGRRGQRGLLPRRVTAGRPEDDRPIPRSYPSRTSVTSSLKRRSPATSMFSATTTPLRVMRAFAPRLMMPLRTIEPAMLPNLEERKISRTSAEPSSTSSYSGFSMP